MNERFEKTDRVFFILSLIILGAFFVMAALQLAGIFKLTYNVEYPCGFRLVTGFYCPGCGASHSLTSLIDLHIIDSFLYNPFVPYVLLCALLFVVTNTIALIRKKNYLHFRMLYVFIGLGILLGQWIIKNILMLVGITYS